MLRQAEAKTKRAVDKYNQEVRKYNRGRKRAIDDYNREVRAYNTRVRANRQRISRELARLKQHSTTPRLVQFRTSVQTLHQTFVRVENRITEAPATADAERFLELSEQETANSLSVLNALSGQAPEDHDEHSLRATVVTTELSALSADLDARWRGALFALSPENPDAARHFCASAREIFTQVLDLSAPDDEVLSALPACDKTNDGRPTRRAKIKLLLRRKHLLDQDVEDFASQDIENIIQLFRVFNDGTHGSAGRFPIYELSSVKERVEHGILFLTGIAR